MKKLLLSLLLLLLLNNYAVAQFWSQDAGNAAAPALPWGANDRVPVVQPGGSHGFLMYGINPNDLVRSVGVLDSTCQTASKTIGAADMSTTVNLCAASGTPTLTISPVTTTNLQPGMYVTVTNTGIVPYTIVNSSSLVFSGFAGNIILPGSSFKLVANSDGSHLDFIGTNLATLTSPHVSSTAAVLALPTSGFTSIVRDGYYAVGDAAPLQYNATSGVCPLNASFTASISTTVLTVTSIPTGALYVGAPIIGAGVPANTFISSFGTGTGGTGTYNLTTSSTVSSTAMTASGDNGGQIKSSDNNCWIAKFQFLPINVTQFGAKCDNSTDDSLALDIADNSTLVQTIGVDKTCRVSNNVTFSHTVYFGISGALSVDSGKTLTLNGGMQSDNGNPFPGAGTVVVPDVAAKVVGGIAQYANIVGKQQGSVFGASTDPRLSAFGNPMLRVLSEGNINTQLNWAVVTAAGGVPVASIAGCRVDTTGAGNYCAGFYGEGWLDTNGLVEALELDTGSKVAPTTTLPPSRGTPISGNYPIGLTIVCTNITGYTNDCSIGLDIENNGQKFAAAGIYINPNSIASGAYGINVGAPALFGDSTITGNMVTVKGGTGANDGSGAQIELINTSTGVGAPNKFIRVNGVTSALEFVNSSYTAIMAGFGDGGDLTLSSWIQPKANTSANLPTCGPSSEGTIFPLTDSSSAVFNASFAGGGSNHIIAYCNGAGWVVH